MRFTCDSCEARYTIADEKVRGRILKVRCKRCGSPILLRYEEPEEEPAEGGDGDATRVMRQDDVRRAIETGASTGGGIVSKSKAPATPPGPASGERREWYFLENAQEIGPFGSSELTEKARDGRLQPRTYVWRDGMPQWARLHDVEELAPLLAVVSSLSSSAEPASAAGTTSAPSLPRDQPVSGDEDEEEDDQEQEDRTEIGSFADLFAADVAGAREATDAGDSDEDEAESGDNEDDDALSGALDGDAFQGGDLSRLLAPESKGPVVGGAAAREDPFAVVPDGPNFQVPEPGETTNAIIKASGAKERHWGRIALAGLVFVAAAGAILWFGGRSGVLVIPKVTQQREAPPTIDWSKVEALDDSAAGILSGESKRKAEEEARRAAEQARRRTAGAELAGLIPRDVDDRGAIKQVTDDSPAVELSPQQQAQLARLRAERAAGGGPGTAGPRNFVGDTGFDVKKTGGSGPDQQAVARKVGEAQPAIGNCVSNALRRNPNQKVGKVVVVATIGTSGVVTRAEFREDRSGIASSELGDCVRKVVKGLIFPSFDGDPIDLEIPLVLGAG